MMQKAKTSKADALRAMREQQYSTRNMTAAKPSRRTNKAPSGKRRGKAR